MNMDEQIEFLKLLTLRLDRAEIPYMVTGSMAMFLYSIPRMTRDIDVVIDCDLDDAPRIVELFAEDCYVDEDSIGEAIRRRRMFNIIHNEWITKADFILLKNSDYQRAAFARRRPVPVEGFEPVVATAEDLILSKLLWSQQSGSEYQIRDVSTLIRTVAGLGESYVTEWAERLGVSELLERARRQ